MNHQQQQQQQQQTAAKAFRQQVRKGLRTGPTTGFVPGFTQANLVILPKEYAYDFLVFCQRNPKPCPLIDVTDPGSATPSHSIAVDADLRTDVPKYRIFQEGVMIEEVTDIRPYWREEDRMVCFLLGCSFSFEAALEAAGLPIRHIEEKKNVPMYKTSIPCRSAGIFQGNMVVSMRPFQPQDIVKVIQITSRFGKVHGAPVHIGYETESIGIADLAKPDYGDAVTIRQGEIPVFHACGVTPQNIILNSKPCLAITHAPGCMFVCDISNESLSLA